MHELGRPLRRAYLSCQVEGAVWPAAHAGDPVQVGIVGIDEVLQLVVRQAAGLPRRRQALVQVGVLQQLPRWDQGSVLGDPSDSLTAPGDSERRPRHRVASCRRPS
eukprot:355617-Chlamydomonas_euryale.AAC.19